MPSFSIEAPGQAAPLQPDTLIGVLIAAASSDQQQVRAATQQLETWLQQKGYHSMLINAVADMTVPLEARLMACILLKNSVRRNWRPTKRTVNLPNEEKAYLRSKIVEAGLQEDDRQLLSQIAALLGEIVAFDFPKTWPNVFDQFDQTLRQGLSDQKVTRLLTLLVEVADRAVTFRLNFESGKVKGSMSKIFTSIFSLYEQRYVHGWRPLSDRSDFDPEEVRRLAADSLLCLKILRLLATMNALPSDFEAFVALWKLSCNQFYDLANYLLKEELPEIRLKTPIAEAHIRELAKMHLKAAEDLNPEKGIVALPDAINLIRTYWDVVGACSASPNLHKVQDMGEELNLYHFLTVKGCLMLRATIAKGGGMLHNHPTKSQKEAATKLRSAMRAEVFKEAFIRDMANTLITQCFLITDADLEAWDADPEEWQRQQEGNEDGWEHLLRPCAERLFLDIFIQYPQHVKRPLLEAFKTAGSGDMDDRSAEAILCAVGLAAPSVALSEVGEEFVSKGLPDYLQRIQSNPTPTSRILLRRFAILLSQFSSISIRRESKPIVYQVFDFLVRSEQDLAVQITAAHRLRDVILEMNFDRLQFTPYIGIVHRIFSLIFTVQEADTKIELLSTIEPMTEQMGMLVSEQSVEMFHGLSQMWGEANSEFIVKQHIVSVMAQLLRSTRENGKRFHGAACPLIVSVVRLGSELQPYLLEEILDLWIALITSADASTSEILGLIPYVFPLTEHAGKTLKQSLDLLDSYILLCPQEMLKPDYSVKIFQMAISLFDNLRDPEYLRALFAVVDDLMQIVGSSGDQKLLNRIAGEMVSTGLISLTRKNLRAVWEVDHQQDSSKNERQKGAKGFRLMRSHLNLYARLAIYSTDIFVAAMRETPNALDDAQFNEMMTWVLEVWVDQLDSFATFTERKVHCLALTQLLETKQPWILNRMANLVSLWTELVGEIQENRTADLIDWLHDLDEHPETTSQEKLRRIVLEKGDVAKTVDLEEVVKKRIEKIQSEVGGNAAFRNGLESIISEDTLAAFSKLGLD